MNISAFFFNTIVGQFLLIKPFIVPALVSSMNQQKFLLPSDCSWSRIGFQIGAQLGRVVFKNIRTLLTLAGAARRQARRVTERDLGFISRALVASIDGKIVYAGARGQIPKPLAQKLHGAREIDCQYRTVLPAFVECHTHLIFAGHRRHEFELRNRGWSYQQIAKRGGGIVNTVKRTRAASTGELRSLAQERVDNFARQGVATVEIKSGYGLKAREELRILKVAAQLHGARIIATYLGPHAIPKGRSKSSYFAEVLKTLRQVGEKKLAQRADIFVEKNYFTLQEGRAYSEVARKLGLLVSIHADQLSRTGAASLVQNLGESADHVVCLSKSDIKRFAKSEATAVLLPAADLYLGIPFPQAREMIEAGVRVALATDFNPGSSPTQDLSLVGFLARKEMKMSQAEVLAAYTLGGAYALGLQNQTGSIEIGKSCDLAMVNGEWDELFYGVGQHPISGTYLGAKKLRSSRRS